MPDIHFECPKCNQSLDAPEELACQLINCPSCKETIEVPTRSLPAKREIPLPPTPMPKSRIHKPMVPGTVGLLVVFCLYLLILVLTFRQWLADSLTYRLLDLDSYLTAKEPSFWPTLLCMFWGVVTHPWVFCLGSCVASSA